MTDNVKTVVKAIDDKKGKDILIYDYHTLNPFIDYTIIASATNQRQVYALAANVVDEARLAGMKVKRMEGDKDSKWILVDLDTIIVHLFLEDERSIYRLEQLYADLPVLPNEL